MTKRVFPNSGSSKLLTALAIACIASCLIGCRSSLEDAAVDALVRSQTPILMEKYRVPGVAIALIEDGRSQSAMGFGYADLAGGTRVQPATIFEVASLGKPLFAYVVVQRALAGVVDLDRAVDAYLDEELARDPQTGRITYLTC